MKRNFYRLAFMATTMAILHMPQPCLALGSCALTVGSSGVMTGNASNTELSSTNSGGYSGSLTATVVGLGITIQVVAPATFTTAPSGGNNNVTFTPQIRSSGATIISASVGTSPLSLLAGLTLLTLDLTATKSAGVFPAGSYLADMMVRCQ